MAHSPGNRLALAVLGAAVAAGLGGPAALADAPRAGDDRVPAPARTPFVEAHAHFDAADPEAAVRAALAALPRENAVMVLFQIPPDTFDHPGHHDVEAVLAAAKQAGGRIGLLGGGGTLNAMILQSAASGDAGPAVQHRFKQRAEQLLRDGVIGFGELTAEHYAGGTPYQSAPPDHPLYLLLADIAAAHGVPIDLHMEAVPEDMALPAGRKSPPDPPRLRANIAAFERLLAHNPRARIIWAHAGADGTGRRTPELCRRLLRAHPNLMMEIKADPQARGLNYPLADGVLRPEWRALFTEFPDRFVVGSDQHYPEPAEPAEPARGDAAPQRWQEVMRVLDQLPDDVRRKIATENAARIYGAPVAAQLRASRPRPGGDRHEAP